MQNCLSDVEVSTELRNITVVDIYGNVTVTYRLTDPFVGRTPDNRNISMTPTQRVCISFICLFMWLYNNVIETWINILENSCKC